MNRFNNKTILFLVAHPDDEWWGSGGTILRLSNETNANIKIIFVAGDRGDGSNDKKQYDMFDLYSNLNIDIEFLNLENYYLNDDIFELINIFDRILENVRPDIIFTHFHADVHQDHQAINKAILATLRDYYDIDVFFIETPFKNDFEPNFFVNITMCIDKKLNLWDKYYSTESVRRKRYNKNFLRKVAIARGLSIMKNYAEGFMMKRGVIL